VMSVVINLLLLLVENVIILGSVSVIIGFALRLALV
jgi:hypothetical protein